MLEGINIISTEVTKDVDVPLFIFICGIACVLMFCSIQLLKAGFEITKSTFCWDSFYRFRLSCILLLWLLC